MPRLEDGDFVVIEQNLSQSQSRRTAAHLRFTVRIRVIIIARVVGFSVLDGSNLFVSVIVVVIISFIPILAVIIFFLVLVATACIFDYPCCQIEMAFGEIASVL